MIIFEDDERLDANKKNCSKYSPYFHVFVATIFISFWLFLYGIDIICSASENSRLVAAFNTDEATHIDIIQKALDNNSLLIDFGFYGHLYFYLVIIPLFFLKMFMVITEKDIILALRTVPVLFGIGTIIISFVFSLKYMGRWNAWIITIFLSTVPLNFLRMSFLSHPDIPQLFFIMGSLLFCCKFAESANRGDQIFSSASAGLAFACKYSGVFLIPVISLVALGNTIRGISGERNLRSRGLNLGLIRVLLGFLGLILWGLSLLMTPEFVQEYFRLKLSGQTFGVDKGSLLSTVRIASGCLGVLAVLVSLVSPLWTYLRRHPKVEGFLMQLFVIGVSFFLAFLLASPFSFYRLSMFKAMLYESAHTSYGDWFMVAEGGLQWFTILMSDDLLSPFIVIVLALGCLQFTHSMWEGGWQELLKPKGILWTWVFIYVVFVVLRVKVRPPRYILPIVPVLIILFVAAVDDVLIWFRKHMNRSVYRWISVGVWLLILAFHVPYSISHALDYRSMMVNREAVSPSVKIGDWLLQNCPHNARILYDHYIYIPPVFKDVKPTWGGTLEVLREYSPDFVAINKTISDRFLYPERSETYAWGKQEYMEIHNYYDSFKNSGSAYQLVLDLVEVQVYMKGK